MKLGIYYTARNINRVTTRAGKRRYDSTIGLPCGCVDDSLLHILCVCVCVCAPSLSLCHLRSDALLAMTDLISSWGQPSSLLPMKDEMWQRYLSNVTQSSVYDEECWLSVHSDSSLQWLFGEVLLSFHISEGSIGF
jgi:hypothetical protein